MIYYNRSVWNLVPIFGPGNIGFGSYNVTGKKYYISVVGVNNFGFQCVNQTTLLK